MSPYTAVELIRAKRDGHRLTDAAIGWLIAAYTDGQIADEQMAAMAMAIYFRGMSPEETGAMMDLIVRLSSERTVILVEHKMKLVMGVSDRIIVLHHGEVLADGTPDNIRANTEVRRVYLGEEMSGA